jgi:hypothetical protein
MGDDVAVPALGQSNFLGHDFLFSFLFLSLKRVYLSLFGMDIYFFLASLFDLSFSSFLVGIDMRPFSCARPERLSF